MARTNQTLGREEEADAALRSTWFGRGAAIFLVGAFLLSIAAIPLGQMFFGKIPPETSTPLLSGKVPTAEQLHDAEKSLEDSSVVMDGLRPITQETLTKNFGTGNSQVLIGTGGWLFYKQGVDALAGEGFASPRVTRSRTRPDWEPNSLPTIVDLKNQLARHGIALVVVPAPDKATIYPEKLWPERGPTAPPLHNPSFEAWKRVLADKGVLVFDPTDTMWRAKTYLKSAQYFPLDSHWTPSAIDLVARNLAAFISSFVSLPEHQAEPYTRRATKGTDPGDLLHLLGLSKTQKLYNTLHVDVPSVRIPNGNILEIDPHADILVLGDSFSGSYDGGGASFAQQIGFHLRRPVDLISVPNGGSWGARFKLRKTIQDGDNRLAGKKLVIYEFVARDLTFGNWMPIDFFASPEKPKEPAAKPAPLPKVSKPTPTPGVTPKPL